MLRSMRWAPATEGLITVYYGGAQKENDAQRFADELRAAFPQRTSNITTAVRKTPSTGSRSMNRPRIAIDAMGGDHAPEEIVAGALLAAQED